MRKTNTHLDLLLDMEEILDELYDKQEDEMDKHNRNPLKKLWYRLTNRSKYEEIDASEPEKRAKLQELFIEYERLCKEMEKYDLGSAIVDGWQSYIEWGGHDLQYLLDHYLQPVLKRLGLESVISRIQNSIDKVNNQQPRKQIEHIKSWELTPEELNSITRESDRAKREKRIIRKSYKDGVSPSEQGGNEH